MNDERLEELDEEQQGLALRLRAVLRESEAGTAADSDRLAAARTRALAATPPRTVARWHWVVGSAAAAVVLAALLLQLGPALTEGGDQGELAAGEALEALTDEVDADFYEDLDLYVWLAGDDGRA